MKHLQKKYTVIAVLIATVTILVYCTKRDQMIDESSSSDNTLYSMKVSAGPAIQPIGGPAWDGAIDAAWNNAKKLTVHAVVPDLGNGTFTGYVGNATDVTMRSVYDANNIYYLVEFNSGQKNVKSALWYFNPAKHLWTQEVTNYTTPIASTTNAAGTDYNVNADGTLRPTAAQDQFVMMFNIANSCPAFTSLSCYAACHVNSSYGTPATPAGGVMYTTGPTELLDVWRARMLQVMNANQVNDCFIDDGSSVGLGSSGTLDKNEVHSDWQIHNGSSSSVPPSLQSAQAADGGFTNSQTLKMNNVARTSVKVPLWVIPSGNYSNSAIMLKDTLAGGAAVKVIAVDSNGVLTLANAATIDPNTAASGTAYQQVGAGDGPKCIPGSIVDAYTGSRGDVIANAFYTGTGWRLLLKRALKTSDSINDVDFSTLVDQPFGIGVMFNGADNQHAIVAGLMLRFQK
ncbi:MAG: ethylbenzene dehydrogenase-related protein [Chitinophagales bacterium]